MGEPVERSEAGLLVEEERLARAAAAGDGEAFATLYERYAQRAYTLALRLCGSEQDAADAVQEAFLSVMRRLPELDADRELAFGSYLFTATRNATYDLIRRQQRSRPSDSIPESATPLGAGAGGMGLDPGDPDEDPDRKVLLEAQQQEVAAANARLPERQREALALRELEEMSYDEIAAVMEMNRNSVAQLISRARINLRNELRGTALASVAVSSPDCERALPLIAARDDGQLMADSPDAAWLATHMAACDTCQVASEAMQEAGASYRAWIPAAIAPWAFKETMARAAELTGSDWSEVAARRGRPADPSRIPGMPAAYRARAARGDENKGSRRRRLALVCGLALLLLLGGSVVALSAGGGGDEATPPARTEADVIEPPAAEPASAPEPKPAPVEAKQERRKPPPTQAEAAPADPEPVPVTAASAPSTAPPAESNTKTKAPPASEPKGGEAGLGGSSTRDPQPESTPPAEPPPTTPPASEEEPVPPTQPPPKPPVRGPGDLAQPPGGPKPIP